jgi:hypothetical protein
LKALEMAATGLPVVSTHLAPLAGIAAAVRVAKDDAGFLSELARVDRASLSATERDELTQVCQANDYDRKFAEVCGLLCEVASNETQPATRIDCLAARTPEGWLEFCARYWQPGYGPWEALARHLFSRLHSLLGRLLPDPLLRAIPARVKRIVRRGLPRS